MSASMAIATLCQPSRSAVVATRVIELTAASRRACCLVHEVEMSLTRLCWCSCMPASSTRALEVVLDNSSAWSSIVSRSSLIGLGQWRSAQVLARDNSSLVAESTESIVSSLKCSGAHELKSMLRLRVLQLASFFHMMSPFVFMHFNCSKMYIQIIFLVCTTLTLVCRCVCVVSD